MKKINLQDKKAISLMVSYVLLIVIAVALSIVVFNALKQEIPDQKKQCPDGLSISIKDYSCGSGEIIITFRNKGLFSIDGAIVRGTDNKDEVASTGLEAKEPFNAYTENSDIPGLIAFGKSKSSFQQLKPKSASDADEYVHTFGYSGELQKISVEPFIFAEDGELIYCSNKIINQEVKQEDGSYCS